MTMRLTERQIQKAIVDYLFWQGFLPLEFAKPGGHHGLAGSVPVGFPDIEAIREDEHVYFEVKAESGKVTPEQGRMHSKLRAAGCLVYVVRSVDEVKAALESEGFGLVGELI